MWFWLWLDFDTIVINIWSWAPDGARHQDRLTDWSSIVIHSLTHHDGLTDWSSVVKWLWLWESELWEPVRGRRFRALARRSRSEESLVVVREFGGDSVFCCETERVQRDSVVIKCNCNYDPINPVVNPNPVLNSRRTRHSTFQSHRWENIKSSEVHAIRGVAVRQTYGFGYTTRRLQCEGWSENDYRPLQSI
jgi:hypothetical protein